MHSHMYFYASAAPPDWDAPPPSGPAAWTRCREIADALIAAVPALRDETASHHRDPDYIWLRLSPRDDIAVHADHVHWDIRYRSMIDLGVDGTMYVLRSVAATLERQFGFDVFENGCQGLGQRGSIDEMPAVLNDAYAWRYEPGGPGFDE